MCFIAKELNEKDLNEVSNNEIIWGEAPMLANKNPDQRSIIKMRVGGFAMKYNQLLVKWPKTIVTENTSELVKLALCKKNYFNRKFFLPYSKYFAKQSRWEC